MTEKTKKLIDKIKQITDQAEQYNTFTDIISSLYNEKDTKTICEIVHHENFHSFVYGDFEIAYALKEQGFVDESKKTYEELVDQEPDNSSALNNLSIILQEKKDITRSFELIQRAHDLNPDDEIISRNFISQQQQIREIQQQEDMFRSASAQIKNENQFVRDKLSCFISSAMADPDFADGSLPIPNWKFKVMMKTDEIKSESLKKQWLQKSYIIKDGRKQDGFTSYYKLNPFLDEALDGVKCLEIPKQWIAGIERLDQLNLDTKGYFTSRKLIKKSKAPFKEILCRDYDELISSYFFANYKTVLVMSGSILEVILLEYLSQSSITEIEYDMAGKKVRRELFECDLVDLLAYVEKNRLLKGTVIHLSNASRIFRNYIHPGKEIREDYTIDSNNADLCLTLVNEVIKAVY
jgi:tetratricopeptide (TPR) repeat protein